MFSVLMTLAFERALHELSFSWYSPLSSLARRLARFPPPHRAARRFLCELVAPSIDLVSFSHLYPPIEALSPDHCTYQHSAQKNVPARQTRPLDLSDEEAESFGVEKIEQFSRKQLLDLYACVECGRCTEVCPASNTGKALSPMHLITKLRDHLTDKGTASSGRRRTALDFLTASPGAHVVDAGVLTAAVDWSIKAGTDIEPTMTAQLQS